MAELADLLPALAAEHADAMLTHELDMVELEFIDDPDPNRFFRIGTNPDGMVMPMMIRRPTVH